MFGFFVGAACLYGLVRVLRGGGSCGHGWHRRRGCDRWAGHRRWGGHRRGGFFLHAIFDRLDTSPGQEKEIRAAADEVRRAGQALKDELSESRGDLARAFRSEAFDESLAAALLARHDARVDELRQSLVGALARVHATLEPTQREDLARFISRGPRPWGGPYRSWA
jgi:Spy/CpxP family protein refolding chaperone